MEFEFKKKPFTTSTILKAIYPCNISSNIPRLRKHKFRTFQPNTVQKSCLYKRVDEKYVNETHNLGDIIVFKYENLFLYIFF